MPIVTGPNPALQGVQIPDQVGDYSRLFALKEAMQNAPIRRQIMQQQAQQGQIDIQHAQDADRDKNAVTAAMQSWDGKSYDDLAGLVQKNGGSATAVFGLQQHALEVKKQASDIAAKDAETGFKNIETLVKRNGVIVGGLQQVIGLPDTQFGAGLQQTVQNLASQGLLDPQHVQQIGQLAQMPPMQARQALTGIAKGMTSFSDQLEQAKQQETERHNQATESNTAAQNANTDAYRDAELKQGAQRLSIENARLNFEKQKGNPDQLQSGTTGDDFLATLPPGAQATIKATANGDIAIPPPGTRNPQAQALRAAVLQYDPTYTDARYKGKQDFKNKGDAQNIVQLSTAMEHADRAISNSAKVGFAPALGNKTFEAPESAAYMQDAEFLTGEVGKLVKNGVLTVDEGNKISSGLTSARQSVRDAALNETMDLLGGKVRGMFQKYKTGTGQDLPIKDFFDRKSQERLVKYKLVDDGSTGTQSGNDPFSQFGGKAH